MANFLIIGSTGLVGREICRVATKCGINITSITSTGVLHTYSSWMKSERWWEDKVQWIRGNVVNMKNWDESYYINKDAVIYLPSMKKDRQNTDWTTKAINYTAPLQCLDICIENKLDKFIYMSCEGRRGASEESMEWKRKCENELLLKSKDINISIIRPGFVFSPEELGSWFLGQYYRKIAANKQETNPNHYAIKTSELANFTVHSALDLDLNGLFSTKEILDISYNKSQEYLFEYAQAINQAINNFPI